MCPQRINSHALNECECIFKQVVIPNRATEFYLYNYVTNSRRVRFILVLSQKPVILTGVDFRKLLLSTVQYTVFACMVYTFMSYDVCNELNLSTVDISSVPLCQTFTSETCVYLDPKCPALKFTGSRYILKEQIIFIKPFVLVPCNGSNMHKM